MSGTAAGAVDAWGDHVNGCAGLQAFNTYGGHDHGRVALCVVGHHVSLMDVAENRVTGMGACCSRLRLVVGAPPSGACKPQQQLQPQS